MNMDTCEEQGWDLNPGSQRSYGLHNLGPQSQMMVTTGETVPQRCQIFPFFFPHKASLSEYISEKFLNF